MNPPMIKLTLDHMRQEIVHAFTARSAEIGALLDAEIKRVIDNFDFQRVVGEYANNILQTELKSAVENAVRTAVYESRADFEAVALKTLQTKLKGLR